MYEKLVTKTNFKWGFYHIMYVIECYISRQYESSTHAWESVLITLGWKFIKEVFKNCCVYCDDVV